MAENNSETIKKEPVASQNNPAKVASAAPQTEEVVQAPINDPSVTESAGKRRSSGVLDELKQLQKDVKEFKPSDLIIPVLSIIILVLLSVFVYIPMISKAISFRNEGKDVQAKIDQLDNLERQLNNVDAATLQTDLADARKVIPFSLQVSDFVQYVNQLADGKHLEFREILAGDIQIRGNNEKRNTDPVVRGVNGPLKYAGKLSDIVDFLDELQSVSPYIISSDNIEIKRLPELNMWELSLVTTGYYMNKNSLPQLTVYSPFSSYKQYQDVLDVFHEKAQNNEISQTSENK